MDDNHVRLQWLRRLKRLQRPYWLYYRLDSRLNYWLYRP